LTKSGANSVGAQVKLGSADHIHPKTETITKREAIGEGRTIGEERVDAEPARDMMTQEDYQAYLKNKVKWSTSRVD